MDKRHQPYNRRWYDAIQNLDAAITSLKLFPQALQEMVASSLNQTINRYRKTWLNKNSHTTMGVNNVLGLYKASKRKRWYDRPYDKQLERQQDQEATATRHFKIHIRHPNGAVQSQPSLHRAITMMVMVPPKILEHFAKQVLDIATMVRKARLEKNQGLTLFEMVNQAEHLLKAGYMRIVEEENTLKLAPRKSQPSSSTQKEGP